MGAIVLYEFMCFEKYRLICRQNVRVHSVRLEIMRAVGHAQAVEPEDSGLSPRANPALVKAAEQPVHFGGFCDGSVERIIRTQKKKRLE